MVFGFSYENNNAFGQKKNIHLVKYMDAKNEHLVLSP